MRLAVFTGRYPGRVATFFERDTALLHAGIEVDVFPLRPYDPTLWRYSLVVGGRALPRDRVHNIGLPQSLRQPWPLLRLGAFLRDAAAVAGSAACYGLGPLAKTLYAMPKALAWAGRDAAPYDHVLAYWGNYAGTCAYLFHRLTHRHVPFSIWLHAGKGFDFLLRAVAMLVQRGVALELELVGDGPEADALRALARTLGIADRVRFRGWVRFADAQAAAPRCSSIHPPSWATACPTCCARRWRWERP